MPGSPRTLGHEAAGVVGELGEGVVGTRLGTRVFGLCEAGAAQTELAVLAHFAPIPACLSFEVAAALTAAFETAARALDQLCVAAGTVLLINGASGNVG